MSSEVLKCAINELRQVVAYRDGHVREFCPHIIGWTDGEYRTFVWKFGGYSSEGLPEGGQWRCFRVYDLIDAKLQDGPWYRGWTTGQREQRYITQIELAVDPDHAAEVRQISRARIPRPSPPRRGQKRRR